MSTMMPPPLTAEPIEEPVFRPGLDVLNASEGHIEINFDNEDKEETKRAKKIITDMLKRGYGVFVDEGNGKLKRVKRFSKKQDAYIIDDTPDDKSPKTKKNKRTKVVPRRMSRVTGIAPTAGG